MTATEPRNRCATELLACALYTLWTKTGVDDTLRAAELLHATAAAITAKIRDTGSVAGSHPDIAEALAVSGIVDGESMRLSD